MFCNVSFQRDICEVILTHTHKNAFDVSTSDINIVINAITKYTFRSHNFERIQFFRFFLPITRGAKI